jgi:hypothetical protein
MVAGSDGAPVRAGCGSLCRGLNPTLYVGVRLFVCGQQLSEEGAANLPRDCHFQASHDRPCAICE